MRRIFLDLESSQATQVARGPFGWIVFAPGTAMVLLGVVIWAIPAILVALIAGACIAVGGLLLLLAWRLRQRI